MAHDHYLQPASIAARPRERVTTGQLLGRLGNSGGSYAPHLHFQLADGLAFYNSNGLRFVLDRYTVVGTLKEDADAPDRVLVDGDTARSDRHLPARRHCAGLSLTSPDARGAAKATPVPFMSPRWPWLCNRALNDDSLTLAA